MAPSVLPSYLARMTPEQRRQFMLVQQMNQSQPLSYNDWLAQRGLGPQQAQQTQQAASPDYSKLFSSAAESDVAAEALGLSSGSGAASTALATDAGANAAFNAAAMEAGGAPMTLMESGIAAPAASAWELGGIGSAGNAYLPILGVAGGADVLMSDYGPGRGALQGAASGAAMGSYFGPPGIAIGAGIGGAVGLGKGLMKHESTRDHAKKNTKKLEGKFQDDATYQAYVRGMREQHNSAPPDPSKPFAGKYATWEDYKKGGLEAGDLTGVLGNIETFGKDWTNLNFDQQKAVTQALIDAGQYDSKKGEVRLKDAAKSKQIFDSIANTGFKIPKANSQSSTVTNSRVAPDGVNKVTTLPDGREMSTLIGVVNNAPKGVPAPMMIPRSSTSSPGIGKDGKRINYGRR